MKQSTVFVLLFALVFVFQQCKTQNVVIKATDQYAIPFGDKAKVIFLDSAAASLAIVKDESDRFFDRVSITEMEIQMKSEKIYTDRAECLSDYIDFMKTDVTDFTKEEIDRTSKVFNDIKAMLSEINPRLLNQDIILIKTKANHYGNSVYYTRENKIVIPYNELANFNEQGFTETMLHEFSHIFNRYNKSTRDQLYDLIGFKEVRGPILLPEELGKRKLLNPDGTTDYAIELKDINGEKVMAYPLISASADHYLKSKPMFFNYLVFHMYNLQPMEDNVFQLQVDENGSTTIPFDRIPSFFTTIKDNTNYIIHPDEIMADNFKFVAYDLGKGRKLKKFSEEGQRLLDEIGAILKAY